MKTIYNKILLAMDNSENAYHAAERVLNLVNKGTTQVQTTYPIIIAFHSIDHHFFPRIMPIAVPSSFGSSYSVPAVDYSKLEQEYRTHGKNLLKKTEDLFKKENITIKTRLVTDEKPEDYVERIVEEENIDLVVLGSKGEHSKLEQIFLGSVAQKVVNDVNCDILVIR